MAQEAQTEIGFQVFGFPFRGSPASTILWAAFLSGLILLVACLDLLVHTRSSEKLEELSIYAGTVIDAFTALRVYSIVVLILIAFTIVVRSLQRAKMISEIDEAELMVGGSEKLVPSTDGADGLIALLLSVVGLHVALSVVVLYSLLWLTIAQQG